MELLKALFWILPYRLRYALAPPLSSEIRSLRALRTSNPGWRSLEPFDQHRCIFVHIPKAAGKSVTQTLFGMRCGDHASIRQYMLVYTKMEFESYFKFTFVRNPWDRLFSAYKYLATGGGSRADHAFSETILAQFPDFDSFVTRWVNRRNIFSFIHFMPQHRFLCCRGLKPEVDFIGYYERIEDDFASICRRLGVDASLLHINRSDGSSSYLESYSDATRAIVGEVYREDIEMFGYDFGNRTLPGTSGRATSRLWRV